MNLGGDGRERRGNRFGPTIYVVDRSRAISGISDRLWGRVAATHVYVENPPWLLARATVDPPPRSNGNSRRRRRRRSVAQQHNIILFVSFVFLLFSFHFRWWSGESCGEAMVVNWGGLMNNPPLPLSRGNIYNFIFITKRKWYDRLQNVLCCNRTVIYHTS